MELKNVVDRWSLFLLMEDSLRKHRYDMLDIMARLANGEDDVSGLSFREAETELSETLSGALGMVLHSRVVKELRKRGDA